MKIILKDLIYPPDSRGKGLKILNQLYDQKIYIILRVENIYINL